MAIRSVNRAILLLLAFALGAVLSAPRPALAQNSLERQLLGLGAAVILDQMNQSQQRQQKQRQARPQAQQPRAQAPRVDPARQAAMELQRSLNALGFDAGPVDGMPGARTRAAVKAYQVSRGFPATGSLTAMQRLALDTDARAGASGGAETAELRRTEVYEAQSYLRELGFDPGRPDGAWGPRSQAALDAFRRNAGLSGFGTPLSPRDEAALYARVHGVAPTARPGLARVATNQVAQVAPPGSAAQAGPSFDCSRAGSATEWAICGSPRLAALDRQLAAAWSAAVSAAGGSANLLPRQKAWIAARDGCGADAACLDAQMTARIAELTGAPPAPAGGGAVGGAGGFAVARFGADGVSVPGSGARQGSPTGSAARSATLPAIGSGGWVHMARFRFLEAPDTLPRRLLLNEIKLHPETLSNDQLVLQNLAAQRAAQSGRHPGTVGKELAQLNPLERQDLIETHRQSLLEASQQVAEVTPERPIPLAVYLEPTGSNNYGRLDYVEGEGLRLRRETEFSLPIPSSPGYPGSFVVSGVLPGIDILPMSRDEASAFLNRHDAELAERNRLVQVVWGKLTRLGVDETMAEFANTNVAGRSGFGFGSGRPTTFVPERVTLHYLPSDAGSVVGPETPVLHEWAVDDGVAPAGGGRDALAVARDLGLPIQDGHVEVTGQTREHQQAWLTFTNLAWVGANPDIAREGKAFAAIAAALLPDVQKRAFFGDQQVGGNYDLARTYDPERPERLDNVADSAFRDEFLREDAKRAFLANYYDDILARTPQWPLPMLHKVQVVLGEYDFSSGAFPIRNLENATFRVAATEQLQVTERGRAGLYSVDRFGKLPGSLPMPPDQARRLRDTLRAADPYGESRVTLAWWSDLDWSEDATEIENLLSPRFPVRPGQVRPGRATLTRVALFIDPQLSQPLMEIDPEAVLIPNPEPESRDAESAGLLARIGSVERASGPRLLAAVARGLGGDEADWERLARTQDAVLQANEFEVSAAVAETVEALKAQPEGSVWIEGTAQLAEYDLESGTFGFPEGSGYVRFSIRGDTGKTQITPTLVGVSPFESLPVERELARDIVESERRQVRFLLRATPQGVRDRSHPQSAADRPQFELILQAEETIFWRTDDHGEPSDVLAALSYKDDNAARAERLARRFEPSEFESLGASRPALDPHVVDLLLVRSLGAVPGGAAGDMMMLAAFRNERGDTPLPGPRFFEGNDAPPQGPEAELLRPGFASYMQAKAAALGDRFVLKMVRLQNQPPCGKAAEAGSIYGGGRAVFDALPQAREDANALQQRLREAEGAFRVERRYGLFQQRPSARYSSCEQWFAFVVLDDAVHEGRDAGNAAATQVEFTLEDVERYDGASPVPDMILRGRAEATRLVAADGSVGEVVEAASAAEPEAEPQPDLAPTAEAAVAASGSAGPTPSEAEAHRGDWPEPAEFAMKAADIDVLGLRTGQSMEEAERLILERGGVLAGYETPPGATGERGTPALAYRRVYIARDGMEALSLGSYAPDGPVVALMRRMVLSEGRLPYDQIAATLKDKYGPPDADGTAVGMEGLMAWLGDATGPSAQVCSMIPFSGRGISGWRRLDRIGSPGWQLPRGGRGPWQFGLPEYPAEMLDLAAPCGVVLTYVEERPEQWGASGFSVLMVDFDAIRRAEEAMKAGESHVEIQIEF